MELKVSLYIFHLLTKSVYRNSYTRYFSSLFCFEIVCKQITHGFHVRKLTKVDTIKLLKAI